MTGGRYEALRYRQRSRPTGDGSRSFAPGRAGALEAARETYELLRLYGIYRAVNAGKEQIRLFRTMEEAEAWLGE